jgi:hypothetical protein
MCSVLLRANEFLTAALALDGSTVGADEIFQYVIVSLADAKLHVLTTLYAILSRFRLVDLATSQVDFLIERLKIAAQFLDGQSVPVPPFVLLPFQQSSPTMVLHSEEPVGIHGFAVWALPTFVKGSAPARLCCTGDPADVAIAYAYDQVDCTVLPENVMTMPTILGAIFHVVAESINPHELIYVPEGDFVRALPDIGLMSNLLLMKRFAWIEGDLSLSLIPSLLEEFCRLWPKVREDRARDSVLAVIKDIQKALIGRSLPRDYQLTGIVDPPLIEALRTEIPAFRKEAVYIDPRIKAWICQLASS